MNAHCRDCGLELESHDIFQDGILIAQYWTHGDAKDATGNRLMDDDHQPNPYEGTA